MLLFMETTNTKARRFTDAPNDKRCMFDITLRDGSKAQCGRYRKLGCYCRQHAKIQKAAELAAREKAEAFAFKYRA
jgi:hypothetical protein